MREPTHPHLSGWCSGQAGCDSGRAHDICQGRLDAELLARCECDRHESAQNPHSVRDSGVVPGRIGAESNAAPGGASTPDSQGLANADKER